MPFNAPFNYLPDVLTQRKEAAYSPAPFALLPNAGAERDTSIAGKGKKAFAYKNRAVNETNAIHGPAGGYAPGANPMERTQNAAGGMDVNAPSRGSVGAMNPNNLGADFARYAGQRITGSTMPGAMAEVANTNAPSGTFQPNSMPQIPNAPSAGMNAASPGLSPGGYERISSQGMEAQANEGIRGPLPPIYNNKSYSEDTGGFDAMADLMGKATEAEAKFRAASGQPAPLSAQQGPLQAQDLATQESGMQPDPYKQLEAELLPAPDPRLQAEAELKGDKATGQKGKGKLWRAGQFGLGMLGGLAAGNPLLGLYAGIEGARGTPFIQQRMGEIEEQQKSKRASAVDRFNLQKQRGIEGAADERNENARLRTAFQHQRDAAKLELDIKELAAKIDKAEATGANAQELTVIKRAKLELEQRLAVTQEAVNAAHALLYASSADLNRTRIPQVQAQTETEGARKKQIESGTAKNEAQTADIKAGGTGSGKGAGKDGWKDYQDTALKQLQKERTAEYDKPGYKQFDDPIFGDASPSVQKQKAIDKIEQWEVRQRAEDIAAGRVPGANAFPAPPAAKPKIKVGQ